MNCTTARGRSSRTGRGTQSESRHGESPAFATATSRRWQPTGSPCTYPQSVTRYDDVALEAALLCDVRAARRFVERELGPLTSPDARICVLRDTLGSYLQSGMNAAATAAVLNVSRPHDRIPDSRHRGSARSQRSRSHH